MPERATLHHLMPRQRTPSGEAISDYVQSLIFDGRLRPGDRIQRDRIARELGTSQLPVREALLRLEAQGAVVIEPHRGAFVAHADEDTVREHWQLVGIFMGATAARVAQRGDPAVLAQLQGLVEAMGVTEDSHTMYQLAIRSTRLINASGGTVKVRNAIRQFGHQVPGNFFDRIPGSMAAARTGYRAIVGAIRSGDPDGARRAVAEYLDQVGNLVVEALAANGALSSGAGPEPEPSAR